jgi:hypothetical protein
MMNQYFLRFMKKPMSWFRRSKDRVITNDIWVGLDSIPNIPKLGRMLGLDEMGLACFLAQHL